MWQYNYINLAVMLVPSTWFNTQDIISAQEFVLKLFVLIMLLTCESREKSGKKQNGVTRPRVGSSNPSVGRPVVIIYTDEFSRQNKLDK